MAGCESRTSLLSRPNNAAGVAAAQYAVARSRTGSKIETARGRANEKLRDVSDADTRRRVPRTDAVLGEPAVAEAVRRLGRGMVKQAVAAAQERVRAGQLDPRDVASAALEALPATACGLRAVLNATGVLLHTNLGRAPLSAAARAALDLAAGTCDVELDLATSGRGTRGHGAVDALLAAVPGAAAAHLVNNGAAALTLVATGLAAGGREIVIARGE